ncbi:MAG TPA: hypothetical protein VFN30_14715 [Chitinophagaceae bacterium]|nr:hypothetical protein [Chitinophagaceae bacterium]
MKKIIKIGLLILLCFCINAINAQSQNATLTFGVVMPDPSNELSQEQIQKLTSKITQIINNSNEVTVGYTNDIVVYPIITIDETNVVEGGLQNITVTTMEFSLFIKQVSTNLVYNFISKKIKGSGNNKSQAITNAFSQIKPTEEFYRQFILTSKSKILKYYTDNCKTIIKSADNLSAKQEYEQSISLLQLIPIVSTDCYDEAQKKSIEIYKKYQSVLCSKNITKAKAAIAINDYATALEALNVIDPTSTCYPEVQKLIAQISSKVDKKEQQELDLKKRRINAIKEIGKTYYLNIIKVVKYNVLIR